MGVTFLSVSLTWVFFRSEDITSAINYLLRMIIEIDLPSDNRGGIFFVSVVSLFDWVFRKHKKDLFKIRFLTIRFFFYLMISFSIILNFYNGENKEFIYFQF